MGRDGCPSVPAVKPTKMCSDRHESSGKIPMWLAREDVKGKGKGAVYPTLGIGGVGLLISLS